MVCRVEREVALRRKLQVLGSITTSKSANKRRSAVLEALHYINDLKLKAEAINKDCYKRFHNQLQLPSTEVKVEKVEQGFLVRVWCKRGRESLVKVLEAFEEVGLNVLQATVSCNSFFSMEARGEAQVKDLHLDAEIIKEAILSALHEKVEENGKASNPNTNKDEFCN